MKKFLKIALCSSVMVAGSALTAQAASVTSVVSSADSVVVLERSDNFQSATTNTNVLAGDTIYALNGASADVALTSSCSVTVENNQVLTVNSTKLADCAAMYSLEAFNADHLTKLEASNLEGGSGLIIALLAAAAIVAGIVINIDDSEDNPSSP